MEFTTLTGLTWEQVYERINANMGKKAYSKVPGGANLTDIKPAYTYDLLTEVFGSFGIGWGYTVISHEYVGSKEKNGYATHYATATVSPWFATVENGRVDLPHSVGGSDNSIRHYAESGAITNAIGKGFQPLGVQRWVYMNEDAPTVTPETTADDAEIKAEFEEILARAKKNDRLDPVIASLGSPKGRRAAFEAYVGLDKGKRIIVSATASGEVVEA